MPQLNQLNPAEKRALLKRLLADRIKNEGGDFPLAHGQRALWFLQKLLPEMYAYNVAFAARISPRLELGAFQTAIEALVARHQSLRTVFVHQNGEPMQHVLPPGSVPVRIIETSGQTDEQIHTTVCADYQRPFCLETSPLSVSVYCGTDEDILLLNVHHLAFDAWSLQVLFEDLRILYKAALYGQQAALPPLGTPYRDFVTWQAGLLASPEGQRLSDYWIARFADLPPALDIPTSYPRPPMLLIRGASVPFAFDAELSAGLRDLARRHQTTVYTVLLAAMQLLLYQFSGQRDVTVGTPVSLRNRSAWEQVIGYFINMLPMRGRIETGASFTDHLNQTRQVVLDALAHQDFPFSLLIDRIKLRRETDRSPLFQAMLNVHVSPRTAELSRLFDHNQRAGVSFGDSQLTPYLMPQQEGQFEIVIEVTDSEEGLHGNLKYQTDLYSEETARRMADVYREILTAAVVDPEMRMDEVGQVGRDQFEV